MITRDLRRGLQDLAMAVPAKEARIVREALAQLNAKNEYRWVAEWTGTAEEHPRVTITHEGDDDQFIMNAAAWLHEMYGQHFEGDITVHRYVWQRGMNMWCHDHSELYPEDQC